jgi:hypothetical protein
VTIAAAISFNSGILFFTDAEEAVTGIQPPVTRILRHQHGSPPACASSMFLASQLAGASADVLRRCMSALNASPPGDCTIDSMRRTVESSIAEIGDGEPLAMIVALYSPRDEQYALFHTAGTSLRDVISYDCQGPAAYLGHFLIRSRYEAARSLDDLDLSTVFSIAVDTLDGIRAVNDGCGASSEMAVMYADGHVTEVQRISPDAAMQREVALAALGGGLART